MMIDPRFADHFRQALLDLDLKALRGIMRTAAPHLPQPKDDAETLYLAHLIRVGMKTLSRKYRRYSERWLAERRTGVIQKSVGIQVGTPPERASMGADIRAAMEESVVASVKAGIDVEDEAPEVKDRMMDARAKQKRRFMRVAPVKPLVEL